MYRPRIRGAQASQWGDVARCVSYIVGHKPAKSGYVEVAFLMLHF